MGEGKDISKIEIDYEIQPPEMTLTADRNQLEQLLINLINNSAEAIGDANKGRSCSFMKEQ